MDKKLLKWCEEHNALQKTVNSFWERFDEYKKVQQENLTELKITDEQAKDIQVFFENVYYGIRISECNKSFIAVEIFTRYEDEDLGSYKVKYNENGIEIGYEFW